MTLDRCPLSIFCSRNTPPKVYQLLIVKQSNGDFCWPESASVIRGLCGRYVQQVGLVIIDEIHLLGECTIQTAEETNTKPFLYHEKNDEETNTKPFLWALNGFVSRYVQQVGLVIIDEIHLVITHLQAYSSKTEDESGGREAII